MSFLTGNDYTSFWSDLSALGHNALTGELTDSQKADISKGTTQLLTACQEDPSSDACQQLQKQNTDIVNKVAPTTANCDIRLPVVGCMQFGNLASIILVVGLAMVALYFAVLFNPRRL